MEEKVFVQRGYERWKVVRFEKEDGSKEVSKVIEINELICDF